MAEGRSHRHKWPEEDDADTDRPIRLLLRAVHRHELTPDEALQVTDELDL